MIKKKKPSSFDDQFKKSMRKLDRGVERITYGVQKKRKKKKEKG
jgi:hypothetical protein